MSDQTGPADPLPDARPRRPLRPSERRSVERVRPTRPGSQILRVSYPRFQGFARRPHGRLAATIELERPRGLVGRFWRVLIGAPISSELEAHERLPKKKALAVFSSDALSSVAYAPQETLVVLLAAGTTAISWSLPISIAIACLLAIVITSYRQTINAYPTGGGSYIVARGNLGELPGLVAASALIIGYIMTVAVSVASAVDQIVAAAPTLEPLRVELAVGAVVLVTLANLRGMRESGSIFAVPTYFFLVCMFSMIAVGMYLMLTGGLHVPQPAQLPLPIQPVTLFLILRAFAVGSAVMTGTEAISDGVMAFQSPEPRNASRTLMTMGTILAVMFLGLSVLIVAGKVIPTEDQTVISLLARGVFGESPIFYLIQGSATLILILAANTAYADFPRLGFFLARDHYAPHQLGFRGERLAFSNGIVLLGVISSLLIVVFGGSTGALLPLYACSVFTAFTLSQSGMTMHWVKEKGPHWRLKAAVNGLGASVTCMVALIAAFTNLMNPNLRIVPFLPIGYGSWLVLVIVPLLVITFRSIRKHYAEVQERTKLTVPTSAMAIPKNVVVVPVAQLNLPTLQALNYARALSSSVMAVHIAADSKEADALDDAWDRWAPDVPLTIIDSPYRSLTRPLLFYLTELKRVEKADIVTVVVPEYVPDAWWEHLLHGQSAAMLKLLLLFTPGFVVVSVPYHEGAVASAAPAAEAVATGAEAASAGEEGWSGDRR